MRRSKLPSVKRKSSDVGTKHQRIVSASFSVNGPLTIYYQGSEFTELRDGYEEFVAEVGADDVGVDLVYYGRSLKQDDKLHQTVEGKTANHFQDLRNVSQGYKDVPVFFTLLYDFPLRRCDSDERASFNFTAQMQISISSSHVLAVIMLLFPDLLLSLSTSCLREMTFCHILALIVFICQ